MPNIHVCAILISILLDSSAFSSDKPPKPGRSLSQTKKSVACDFSAFKPLRGSFDRLTTDSIARPTYPEEAKRQGIEGEVIVKVLVNKDGTVTKACVENGHAVLREASIEAALKNSFAPVILNHHAVPWIERHIVFKYIIAE